MHELAVAQALIGQVETIACEEHADRVLVIHVGIGPLSGVEARLLEQAFPVAAADTIAATAGLVVEQLPVRVNCRQCGRVTDALPNRLVCGHCGDWHTTLVSGDELLLTRVELTRDGARREPAPAHAVGNATG